MDAVSIQAILEAGNIGDMPFPEWTEQVGRVLSLDAPRYMGRPIPKDLSELGVVAVRWEPGDNNPDEQRLWQAYLVVTLPEAPLASRPSLKLIDDIAVEACGARFYVLKGRELWIEYLVARTEVRDSIEMALEMGKIGELPFPMWFRYNPVSTGIKMMAYTLAARSVIAVRWEEDEYLKRMGVNWLAKAYIVVTLPMSASVSPPTLPSHLLVLDVTMILHGTYCFTRVTETAVEVWLSYTMDLPLAEPPGELIEEGGITYISFATPKERRKRACVRRQELWKALVNFLRRS